MFVLIFHAQPAADAGPLTRALAEARLAVAARQRLAFVAAGADEAEIVAGPPDGLTFGERLRNAIANRGAPATRTRGGVVVLGSGAVPLARAADLRRFVDVAAGTPGHALANNRYSADIVAISRAADLADLPPLPDDNALPRWLEERAGVAVSDLRPRWRLSVDIDTPLDLVMLGESHAPAPLVGERLNALAAILHDRRAELLLAGRISAATLTWAEAETACRIRAFIEERGLRAASLLAQAGATTAVRPPTSVLGQLLDRDGPESHGRIVATMGDGAIIDTRVLLAHRFGADESAWPSAEDRFASDLLLSGSIADPWLRALTDSACASDHPIVLGGHTTVNGGLRLLAQRAGAGRP